MNVSSRERLTPIEQLVDPTASLPTDYHLKITENAPFTYLRTDKKREIKSQKSVEEKIYTGHYTTDPPV